METSLLLINFGFVVLTRWSHWLTLVVFCDCSSIFVRRSLVVPKLGCTLRHPRSLENLLTPPDGPPSRVPLWPLYREVEKLRWFSGAGKLGNPWCSLIFLLRSVAENRTSSRKIWRTAEKCWGRVCLGWSASGDVSRWRAEARRAGGHLLRFSFALIISWTSFRFPFFFSRWVIFLARNH